MRPEDAISRIDAIHAALDRSATFRGYRSESTMLSAVFAMVAALGQATFIPDPSTHLYSYLILWGAVALASLMYSGWHLLQPCLADQSPGETRRTASALCQLLPGLLAGACLTFVIVWRAPEVSWMLPGLWSVCFGLAVCSAATSLPKQTFLGGGYFILAGGYVLSFGSEDNVLAPWNMVITFAFGQAINAFILFWTIERNDMRRRAQND